MNRRSVVPSAALFLALVLAPVLAAADLKIGVVDIQKAMEQSTEGTKAKAQFQKKVEKLQGELKAKQDEITALKDELERQSSVLSQTARDDKEKAYQYKLRDYQRLVKDSQEELQREDQELSQKILKDLQRIIENFGKAEGFDIILERTQSAVLFRSDAVDVTQRIIQLYDQSKKSP